MTSEVSKPAGGDSDLTLFICGPKRCEHDFSGPFVEVRNLVTGKVEGGTAVCMKCGARAIDEGAWL
jgi:hypothetical protein